MIQRFAMPAKERRRGDVSDVRSEVEKTAE